jgi:hypothetical protein
MLVKNGQNGVGIFALGCLLDVALVKDFNCNFFCETNPKFQRLYPIKSIKKLKKCMVSPNWPWGASGGHGSRVEPPM